MTIQYHAGGGVLTGEIGHLFARRRESARIMRAAMAVQKPLYHLGSARSLDQLRERMRLFFTPGLPAGPARQRGRPATDAGEWRRR